MENIFICHLDIQESSQSEMCNVRKTRMLSNWRVLPFSPYFFFYSVLRRSLVIISYILRSSALAYKICVSLCKLPFTAGVGAIDSVGSHGIPCSNKIIFFSLYTQSENNFRAFLQATLPILSPGFPSFVTSSQLIHSWIHAFKEYIKVRHRSFSRSAYAFTPHSTQSSF